MSLTHIEAEVSQWPCTALSSIDHVLHFTSIAFVNFIDVRDKLDTLADDEEDHDDDQDSGHAGFLNQGMVGIFTKNKYVTFLEAWRLLGWDFEDFLVLQNDYVIIC